MHIAAIDYIMGSEQVPVEELARQADLTGTEAAQMQGNGLRTVSIWPASERSAAIADFLAAFGRRCVEAFPSLAAVVVAKTHLGAYTLGAEQARQWLAGSASLPVPALEICGQPCAILHSGVALAEKILAEGSPGSAQHILLIGCDVAASASERCYFGSAMSDACVAILLSNQVGNPTVLAAYSETNVVASRGELSAPEEIARFRQHNAFWIRDAILKGLARAGRELDDHCVILPHTPNENIIEAVRMTLKLTPDRIFSQHIGQTGHCCSNDSFITFARLQAQGRLQAGTTAVLINGGFGGTRGVTVIAS